MRRHIYTLLNEQETKELEEILKSAGFKSRTDYFTACSQLTIYGKCLEEWIASIRKLATDKKAQETCFFELLTETSFPVIAMKGCETACKALTTDLQMEFFQRTGTALAKDQIKHLIEVYAMIHAPEIQRYRNSIHAENLRGGV